MMWWEGNEFWGPLYTLANYDTIALRWLTGKIRMSETGSVISIDLNLSSKGKNITSFFVFVSNK